ncbi:MAG: tRNA (adenosine(37)-N6)-threonylcarbamoyltransferase complex ATPase subunit type 1 TsaE [Deltaproteobacteria bacterium]|nr:tRNA (adenosine(37)-N6)-threonylcarbamoyltransferase complex ATPase subunit type 1 TsaE [Deltaproteobacteria bacterium]
MEVFTTNSPEETEELGKRFASGLGKGSVVALTGELGAGKTQFTRGIAAGLGVKGYHVKSPSFTIVRVYGDGRLPLYHIDLYRLKGASEINGLGLEEYIYGDGVSVIEWAEKAGGPSGTAGGLLPEDAITIRFFYEGETKRRIEVG